MASVDFVLIRAGLPLHPAPVFNFLFDIPLVIAAPALILTLATVRRRRAPDRAPIRSASLRIRTEDSEFSGAIVQAIMVFYGLAVALIAVNVWQTYSDTRKWSRRKRRPSRRSTVTSEATRRRSRLRSGTRCRNYTSIPDPRSVAREQAGRLPRGAVVLRWTSFKRSHNFEPATEGQKILHAETLSRLQPDDRDRVAYGSTRCASLSPAPCGR